MRKFICLTGILAGLLLAGCVGVDQEWVHRKHKPKSGWNYHCLVPGHIRWYQYNNGWYQLGGKPPAGIGGIIYTIWHPGDWFWYGPYEKSANHSFKSYWKKDCGGCRASFDLLLKTIKEKQEQLRNTPKTEDNIMLIMSLENQIMNMDENNDLQGDFNTPFEKRFK